jgi:hypothetical protein
MFFFNFIGLAYALAGMLVGGGLWFLFGQWFGDSVQALAGGMFLGSLFTAFLDLRYRWLGEAGPETAPIEAKPGKPEPAEPPPEESFTGQLTSTSLSFVGRCWNLVWPFAGGHILWIPMWAPAAFFFTAYFLGYLGWIFPAAATP